MDDKEGLIERSPLPTRDEKPPQTIDIGDLYRFKPEDLSIELLGERYSNLAYMQVTHRDVYIDFLSMPGIKKDDKMAVQGVRVFMSHVAAQRLAESLIQILDDMHKKRKMETYISGKRGENKPSTKITRTVKEEMI